MKHGSLFSGIGGFDLAADMMGWDNVFHCEINPFCRKILNYYYPNAESFEDIKKTDFKKFANTIDIISGGFPCQPFSGAGKRRGTEDERYLWEEMLRAIEEIQPSWVVAENVFGLVNWNGGMVFNKVQTDLESKGYEVWSYLLAAASINAPHRRERVFFIGKKDKNITDSMCDGSQESNEVKSDIRRFNAFNDSCENVGKQSTSDSMCESSQRSKDKGDIAKKKRERQLQRDSSGQICNQWENFPSQSAICGGDDGFSCELDNITFSKWREESIKGYGNAVVPQLIVQLFKTIEAYENLQD